MVKTQITLPAALFASLRRGRSCSNMTPLDGRDVRERRNARTATGRRPPCRLQPLHLPEGARAAMPAARASSVLRQPPSHRLPVVGRHAVALGDRRGRRGRAHDLPHTALGTGLPRPSRRPDRRPLRLQGAGEAHQKTLSQPRITSIRGLTYNVVQSFRDSRARSAPVDPSELAEE